MPSAVALPQRRTFEAAKRQGKQAHSFLLDLFSKDTAQAQAALDGKPLVPSNRRTIPRC